MASTSRGSVRSGSTCRSSTPTRAPSTSTSTSDRFALARKHPERVKFLIDHDPGRVAGRFHAITTFRGWLIGGFQLDDNEHGAFTAKRLKYGSPISIGFDPELSPELGQSGTLHRQVARLNGASFVERAAYQGAEVTSILRAKPDSPAAVSDLRSRRRR